MVILGLGSNLGDRLANLRKALEHIKKIPQTIVQQISPIYISDALVPENAPTTWDIPYLNLAIRCDTQLTSYEFLKHTKEIEIAVGRTPEKNWGPRIVDIDLLAWDDLIQYDEKLHIPHEYLHERPFALWPLADIAPQWRYPLPGSLQGKTAAELATQWGSRFTGSAPLHTKQIQQRIDAPQLVGILNITPDSFSDGGQFMEPAAAIQHARELVNAGAEIIDIGAESTGPKAQPLNPTEEWQRLEPVLIALLQDIQQMPIPPKISVDTRHADVAKKALLLNVAWINDVSGLVDPVMRELMANNTNDIVLMHNLGVPVSSGRCLPYSQEPSSTIYSWGEKQLNELEKMGISASRIIFDVGIGYGLIPEHSLALLKQIETFHQLKTRLLIGHSRKSFLQQFTSLLPAERDIETVTLSLYLANKNVNYLRVHNIEAHARAFKVMGALGHANEFA